MLKRSMTRKDYELIAGVMRRLYLGHDDWQRTLPQVASALADALQSTNPQFDRVRFIAACKTN